jgi:parallel beta-helix repeat protein
MFILLIIGISLLAFNIKPAKGEWTGTVYIRADGSIDPPDAPVITFDNVTYTLTGNITSTADAIVIERNSVVIDGNGFTLTGRSVDWPNSGIRVDDGYNVTIKNFNIQNFWSGVYLCSSNNIISGNNIKKQHTWRLSTGGVK